MIGSLRRFYGAHPAHLLVVLACFALAGYVGMFLSTEPMVVGMLGWFACCLVGHDLVLFPMYALVERLGRRLGGKVRPRAINYIRLPLFGVAGTLLLFLPGIIRQGAASYHAASGMTQEPFLGRWLLLSAAMCTVSAVCYVIRVARRPS